MYRFLETIKLKDGLFYRLPYHQQRINRCFAFYFKDCKAPDLAAFLLDKDFPKSDVYKCRVLYDVQGFMDPEFVLYQMKHIQTFKIMNTILEPFCCKPADRSVFEELFALRGHADDVLLVRDGLLTDTSFANIACFDGVKWVTPRHPIIYGTQRAYLLKEKMIIEKDIQLDKLHQYKKLRLFNAMIEFGELEIEIGLK
ncbi:MAG: aminotransferase class IV [Pigmentiphaga sp.]|nr:aminotransferase class IV [Pigmentiphaga sp.]